MEAPLTPLAKTLVPPALDYAWLRAEGLALLEHLSGQVWTDYNTHDPGVTLLEALCYTLTDVSSRAAAPIATLLAAPPGLPAAGPGLLLPPNQAFANHPVTLADYKKLLLDELGAELKNAWITPLSGSATQPAPPSHYQVELELYANPLPDAPTQTSLQTKVLWLLNQHRNLGEVFGRVTVLRPRAITIAGHLEVQPNCQPTLVLAELLWTFSEVLAPDLQADTAARLVAEGLATEDIFAGPLAHHRLLLESAFRPRPRHVSLLHLLRRGSQVAGVHLLSGLRIVTDPATPPADDSAALPAGEVAVLDAAASLVQLVVSQHGVPVAVEANQVLNAYYRLLHEGRRSLQAQYRPDQLRLAAPLGHYASLGEYDSLQELLPALYGVGEEGPPLGASAARRAQVAQLKGYLLLFEQLLADFCAQVAGAGEFFALTSAAPAYRSGRLYGVPYVAPLLPGTSISPDQAWRNDPEAAAAWQQYRTPAASPNAYEQTLAQLAGGAGPALAQRSLFLTHLLARFGYTVQLYQDDHPATGSASEATSLQAQQQLLQHLDVATYHRGAARLSTPEEGAAPVWAESGLEFFLFLLAGLESLPRKWARQERLPEVEDAVQLGNYPSLAGPPRLLVRGSTLHFTRLLDVATGLLRRPDPALQALAPATVRLAPDPRHPADQWELELTNEPGGPPGPTGADTVVDRMLAYLRQLDRRAERASLLDHLVLKPYDELGSLAPPASDLAARAAWDFFHCQVTVLLPGYAARFRPAATPAGHVEAGGRAFVENLIRQYAPAHLLVNIRWLDYPDMREWELVYAALAEASGLLNPSGEFQLITLGAAQHRARRLLEEYLRRPA